MATTQEYGLGEYTYPRGWFMVADASTVTDKPRGVRFFGQDFALYRGKDSGRVFMLDAYCPHMGTHLANNSTSYVAQENHVEGDSIRCPYHAWRFGPDGKCNQIPYSPGPIPPAAKVRSWPVVERLGAVFVWHDPEGGEPEWDAPYLPEWDKPNWVRWQFDDLGLIRQHPQEIVDNISDTSHFSPVHGLAVEYFENEFRQHIAIQRQGGKHRTLTSAADALLETDTAYVGPGVLLSRMAGMMESITIITHTPVDDGSAYVWHALLVRSPSNAPAVTEADVTAARQYQAIALTAFSQDFEVWRSKRACLQGLYVAGDGPFRKQRVWYRQFYNPRDRRQEFLKQVEGLHVPRGMKEAPESARAYAWSPEPMPEAAAA